MARARSSIVAVFLCIAFFAISTSYARSIKSVNFASSSSGSIFTHVCDPDRFANLGLDVSRFGFCNTSLSYQARAEDLVRRMTLTEKVGQLGDKATGVSRLGLPPYNWWSEALHGVSDVGHGTKFNDDVPSATSFPMVILSAASFDESLWKRIGEAVSTEARAMHNLGAAGLTFWSPNINVVRDPRWGRALETPGEDPFVVGAYATNYVRGLQDVKGTENYKDLNSRPLKVSSCCKHYAAYDVDNWYGVERYTFDARVTEQDMVETFLRPFEMCVKDGDVSSVMCSYNKVNGIPTCADPKLLNQTVRGDWGLHGYIVSDCDSIQVLVDDQHWIGDTHEDGVAQTLKAGLDLDCGSFYPQFTEASVKLGKVREDIIDQSLKNLYVVLMRLGFFDGSPQFKSLGKKDICSKEHMELAAEAAKQGIVLLKNEQKTLPLNPKNYKSLAVVGPHANATAAMIGNYAGIPCRYITPLEGLASYVPNVTLENGCENVGCGNDHLINPAMEAAKKADATVLVVGIDLSVEAESRDRLDLLLPGYQTQLINQVAEVAKGHVILVIMSAGGIDISFAKNNSKIKGILWAGYPGEEGGRAIADIIFGQHNPGGKLPLTWHEAKYVDELPMTSMPLRPVDSLGYPGRTYKFFNGSTVYPFGYGLSYTEFNHKLISSTDKVNLPLNKFQHCHDLRHKNESNKTSCPAVLIDDLECTNELKFEIEVENVGKYDGTDVLMVYSKPPQGIVGTHIKQLVDFKRVFVPAGESRKVSFNLNICKSLQIVDYNAYKVLPSGEHSIVLGEGRVSFPVQISFERH